MAAHPTRPIALFLAAVSLAAPIGAGVRFVGDGADAVYAALDDPGRSVALTCLTAPRPGYDPTPARHSFPELPDGAFFHGIEDDHRLVVSVYFPPALVPLCASGAVEPVGQVRPLPPEDLTGDFTGVVQGTNISGNGHLFAAQITFTVDDVMDWEIAVRGTDATPYHTYGNFSARARQRHRSASQLSDR